MSEMNCRITLTVNGEAVTETIEARKTLVDFLRDDLFLTGSHIGCEHGFCGACTVRVNGAIVRPARCAATRPSITGCNDGPTTIVSAPLTAIAATRSPLLTPSAASAEARRHALRPNSPCVIERPSKTIAGRSARSSALRRVRSPRVKPAALMRATPQLRARRSTRPIVPPSASPFDPLPPYGRGPRPHQAEAPCV